MNVHQFFAQEGSCETMEERSCVEDSLSNSGLYDHSGKNQGRSKEIARRSNMFAKCQTFTCRRTT
ncbi:hypothetical protein Hamer_G028936 [Homarus americanus]|uniref:Uncharacterized protein n=1 Tax=Homarus americanus TaxID=6706 RepID=A0A8J5K3M8_HOMAM|nr:hypothetical protein Hamer_G029255 [Homarus americanus]KAG7154104.1 hypothetical protein Hamer_G027467 [Homarus americanus]KAG7155503.1 hypothetical protein Hamer_G030364 [Homarus americanus]KAG7157099.1 hypothetical protein Hamer_G030827 [Homarus americanus]KAG7157625.1 hypothetical protein Hamer_G028043 [Homarus americanus]